MKVSTQTSFLSFLSFMFIPVTVILFAFGLSSRALVQQLGPRFPLLWQTWDLSEKLPKTLAHIPLILNKY